MHSHSARSRHQPPAAVRRGGAAAWPGDRCWPGRDRRSGTAPPETFPVVPPARLSAQSATACTSSPVRCPCASFPSRPRQAEPAISSATGYPTVPAASCREPDGNARQPAHPLPPRRDRRPRIMGQLRDGRSRRPHDGGTVPCTAADRPQHETARPDSYIRSRPGGR